MRNSNFMNGNKRRKWVYGAVAFAVAAATLSGASANEVESKGDCVESTASKEHDTVSLRYEPQVENTTVQTKTTSREATSMATSTTTSITTSTTSTTSEATTTVGTETTESSQEIPTEDSQETTTEQAQEVYVDVSPVAYDIQYVEESSGTVYEVPNWDVCCHSDVKTYMGYQAVTLVASSQYQLLNSSYAFTDEHGLRMYDDGTGARYCVAVGSYYTTTIGQKFDLVMEDGHYVPCILGDAKADVHTNWSNQYGTANGDVVEFIIDNNVYYQVCDMSGTVNWVEGLSGKVQSIILY